MSSPNLRALPTSERCGAQRSARVGRSCLRSRKCRDGCQVEYPGEEGTQKHTRLYCSAYYISMFCSILFCSILLYSVLFCSALLSSALLSPSPLGATQLNSTHSAPFSASTTHTHRCYLCDPGPCTLRRPPGTRPSRTTVFSCVVTLRTASRPPEASA